MGHQDLTFIITTDQLIVITLHQAGPLALLLRLGDGPHAGQVGGEEAAGSHHSGRHDSGWETCVIMETVQQLLSVITIIVSTDRQTIELYCRKWEKSGKNTQHCSVFCVESCERWRRHQMAATSQGRDHHSWLITRSPNT